MELTSRHLDDRAAQKPRHDLIVVLHSKSCDALLLFLAFATILLALLSAISYLLVTATLLYVHSTVYIHWTVHCMMAGIYKQNDSENVKVIIGKLIEKADSNVRPVISVFDCFQNRQANLQRLNKFKVPPFESCAEFLRIALADKDNNKIFVKHTLVDRIYLGLIALMPAKSGECSEEYTIEHDAAEKVVARLLKTRDHRGGDSTVRQCSSFD